MENSRGLALPPTQRSLYQARRHGQNTCNTNLGWVAGIRNKVWVGHGPNKTLPEDTCITGSFFINERYSYHIKTGEGALQWQLETFICSYKAQLWSVKSFQQGMFMSIPQCIISEFPDTFSQWPANDSKYDFDRAILEIPVKNCNVRILLTCPIG